MNALANAIPKCSTHTLSPLLCQSSHIAYTGAQNGSDVPRRPSGMMRRPSGGKDPRSLHTDNREEHLAWKSNALT